MIKFTGFVAALALAAAPHAALAERFNAGGHDDDSVVRPGSVVRRLSFCERRSVLCVARHCLCVSVCSLQSG